MSPAPSARVFVARHSLVVRLTHWTNVAALLVLLLGGLGFWWLEPTTPTFADGLWLAFTTAATVGYGDIVPTTHLSRAFSVIVVLLGLAVLSLVTASLAAVFVDQEVEVEERQIERDLLREIGALREEVRALRAEVNARAAHAPPHAGAAAPERPATMPQRPVS